MLVYPCAAIILLRQDHGQLTSRDDTAAGGDNAAGRGSAYGSEVVGLAAAGPVTEGAVAGSESGVIEAHLGLAIALGDGLGRDGGGESDGGDGELHVGCGWEYSGDWAVERVFWLEVVVLEAVDVLDG